MRSSGINITLLNFGIRQIVLMLLISIGVAAVASFFPVYKTARRKPIDAIRDK
jgi:ABC-type antimicrobial peptide transport system permease subunit